MPLDPNKTPIQIQCDKALLIEVDAYCARTGARRPAAVITILREYFEGRLERQEAVKSHPKGETYVVDQIVGQEEELPSRSSEQHQKPHHRRKASGR
jgi:hypothetical protein